MTLYYMKIRTILIILFVILLPFIPMNQHDRDEIARQLDSNESANTLS
jgi:hypothetical protein